MQERIIVAVTLTVTGLLIAMPLPGTSLNPAAASADPADAAGEGLVIVGMETPPDLQRGDRFLGARVRTVNRAAGFLTVQADDPSAFRDRALELPGVDFVERDGPQKLEALFTPNDPFISKQWGWGPTPGINTIGPTGTGAWAAETGEASVDVAVLDTGVDRSHIDLRWAVDQQATFLFGAQVNGVAEDDTGHGTHTTGTVAARTDNGEGVAGTAQVSILHGKVLHGGAGTFTDVANGIVWATDQGAEIISLSLGCANPDCSSGAVADAVEYADKNGALVVFAAGNEGCPPTGSSDTLPVSSTHVVAVSAVSPDGPLAIFSSCGDPVDLAAPGTGIWSTHVGNAYAPLSGTSMAAPHVSGSAALALSFDSSLSDDQLENLLNRTATDTAAPARQEGHGAVNACEALVDLGASISCPTGDLGSLPRTETRTYVGSHELAVLSCGSDPAHGGACFPTYTNENEVNINVSDDSGRRIGTWIEFRDGNGDLVKSVSGCDGTSGFTSVPDGTRSIWVFLNNWVTFVPCVAETGEATTGTITADFG